MYNTLSYYKHHAKELARRYESAKIDSLHTLLINTFTKGSTLLEIGSGSGRDAAFMVRNGYKVTMVDASEEMISEAKVLHPELAENMQVAQLPNGLHFKPFSFDGVYAIATLMHLNKEEIVQSIKNIVRILKPGGFFLLSVSTKRGDVNSDGIDKKGRYFLEMNKEEWISLCLTHGLCLKKTEISNDGLGRHSITWLTCVFQKV